MPDQVTEGAGEYLEAIFKLNGAVQPVAIPALAARLGVSVASANEMVRRLAERGLVSYEPYRGVQLTEHGRGEAMRVVRRHRLWERFLTDFLGIPWDQVHEEACRLEHVTSALVEERLARFLAAPESCPHGHRIPTAEGELPADKGVPLAELGTGREGEVVSVPEEEPALLRYLGELALKPGQRLRVEDIGPFGGPIRIRVCGRVHSLGRELSQQIMVRPVGGG